MNKELTDELEEISSGLLSKTENKAPDGYFENLPDLILEHRNSQKYKGSPTLNRLRRMIAAAAVVSGICITVALVTKTGANDTFGSEISASDAYEYIITHMDEFKSLIEEPTQLAELSDLQILEPQVVEEYLLQELDGSDIELIF